MTMTLVLVVNLILVFAAFAAVGAGLLIASRLTAFSMPHDGGRAGWRGPGVPPRGRGPGVPSRGRGARVSSREHRRRLS